MRIYELQLLSLSLVTLTDFHPLNCLAGIDVHVDIYVSIYLYISTKAGLKAVSPISFSCSRMSEVHAGGRTAEAETSHQYSVTCCHVKDGSRGAV